MPSGKTELLNSAKSKKRSEQQSLTSLVFDISVKHAMKNDPHSSKSITQLLDDLEKMQHYLLMVKAAALAFNGKFNEYCPLTDAVSPFSKEETAEYFVNQFLELDPDAKLEQAMGLINELTSQLSPESRQPNNHKTDDTTIRISIGRD